MIPLETFHVSVVFCSVYDNVGPFITSYSDQRHHTANIAITPHSSSHLEGDSDGVACNLHRVEGRAHQKRRRDGGHSNEVIFQCYIRRTFTGGPT